MDDLTIVFPRNWSIQVLLLCPACSLSSKAVHFPCCSTSCTEWDRQVKQMPLHIHKDRFTISAERPNCHVRPSHHVMKQAPSGQLPKTFRDKSETSNTSLWTAPCNFRCLSFHNHSQHRTTGSSKRTVDLYLHDAYNSNKSPTFKHINSNSRYKNRLDLPIRVTTSRVTL